MLCEWFRASDTIAAAYAIFRLGMGRAVSVVAAGALIVSSVHLQNLPHLRDYAKAPITLALCIRTNASIRVPGPMLLLSTLAVG